MPGFDAAATVISDAALELGLVPAAIADPWANTITDASVIQLRQLLKPLGRKLRRRRQWKQLYQSYTFNTVNGVSLYPMPADFDRFVDSSAWNRSTQLPLGGPISPQAHQFFQARAASGVFYKVFRTEQDQLLIYPTPTGAETIAYEYLSRFWVQPAPTAASLALGPLTTNWDSVVAAAVGGVAGNSITITSTSGGALALTRTGYDFTLTYVNGLTTVAQVEALITALTGPDKLIVVKTAGTPANVLTILHGELVKTNLAGGLGTMPNKEAPTAKDDVLWFDPQLLVTGLRLEWKKAKGFDTSSEQDDFDEAYALSAGADGAAPILPIGHRVAEPLIGPANVPQTGFGS